MPAIQRAYNQKLARWVKAEPEIPVGSSRAAGTREVNQRGLRGACEELEAQCLRGTASALRLGSATHEAMNPARRALWGRASNSAQRT